MRKFLSLLLLSASFFVNSASVFAITYDTTITSVVQIYTVDSQGGAAVGSGFFMSLDGFVMTNAHVILDPYTGEPIEEIYICYIEDEYDTPYCGIFGTVLTYNEGLDLAIVIPTYWLYWNDDGTYEYEEINLDDFVIDTYVDFSDYIPELGDDISILGFPAETVNTSITLTEGSISAFTFLDESGDIVYYYTTDATINPGNSGGPAYNEDEKVIGVASAYSISSGNSYGYIIANDVILAWFLDLVDEGLLNPDFVDIAFSNDYIEDVENYDEEDLEIFNDVDYTSDNAVAISYLKENGIVGGYSDGTFKPENNLNRAELMKILVEATGIDPEASLYKNCFPDVKEQWFARYVCYAKEQGWVEGYPDSKFKPENNVSKVESTKMILEAFDIELMTPAYAPYEDIAVVAWYSRYVYTAWWNGYLEETGNYYYPSVEITRGGVSENIYRVLTTAI
jgi:V8-like Glu-specific endopeptidase